MNRVHTTKFILWLLVGFAAAVGITRYLFGIGATTNLSDATPWGLWIGFDVMGGVALAGGGFVITAIFYIMRREEFHPMVRPAVLTAFLGYTAVVASLLFDLGLPWNIWHMMIFWNPHSPLFEVGWCVMLYTTVLLLEFSPVPLEATSRYARIRDFLIKYRFWLVLLGIMFSTLHQSSLGSLFLIVPFKSHPLWYTEILPIQFFVSAVGLGLGMVCFESLVTSFLYKREPETSLVAKLCKGAIWVLAFYFVVKFADLAVAGKLGLIVNGSWESSLFIAEILISILIPIALFSIPRVRSSHAGQWVGSSLIVFGMVFNRINVGGLTQVSATGDAYYPSWMEVAITAGVISGAVLVFLFFVEKFKVWERPPKDPAADPHTRPEFDRTSKVWLGTPFIAGRTKYTLAFVVAMALGFALIPKEKIYSEGVLVVETEKARGGDTLFVDGNRDGYGVNFKHKFHIKTLGDDSSCVVCHHMNMPQDRESGCYNCHSEMYSSADAFGHDWHSSPGGGNINCATCHTEGLERSAETAVDCDHCHKDLVPTGASIKVEQYLAPPYTETMHLLCVECHRQKAKQLPEKPNLAVCSTCHGSPGPDYLKEEIRARLAGPYFNRVVLPGAVTGATSNQRTP